MLQSGIMKLYRNVKRRIESRFMRQGIIPGMLFLVSSKKSEYDFLEQYAKEVKNDPGTYIVDEPVWNVKPSDTYTGEKFPVAVGNKFLPSRVLNADEDRSVMEEQGYNVIDVPIEYKKAFDMDVNSSLMDIAGIATVSKTKFMDARRIRASYNPSRLNPFATEVITLGMDDNMQVADFMRLDKIDPVDKRKPGFIHLDLSFATDRTGVSYTVIDGRQNVSRYRSRRAVTVDHDLVEPGLPVPESGEMINEIDTKYKQIFSVGLQAPAGSELEIGKVREFIYFLRRQGFNIKGISADTFQSKDTLQQLEKAGFKVTVQSLDKTPVGYLTARTAINEGRVDMLNMTGTVLERELSEVEQDSRGKVDHPPVESGGCFSGETEILLIDQKKINMKGSVISVSFSELTSHYDRYSGYQVISVDESGNPHVTDFINPHVTKEVSELIEITLDNDEVIRCTPDHRFLCKLNEDYLYVEAQHLQDDDYDLVTGDEDKVSYVNYLLTRYSSKKVLEIAGSFIAEDYLSGMSLYEVSNKYLISKTSLNWYLTEKGLKRTKSEAYHNAEKQGKSAGAQARYLNDPDYKERALEILKRGRSLIAYSMDPKYIESRHQRVMKLARPEVRMKASETRRAHYKEDPELRERLSKQLVERNTSPEFLSKIRPILKERNKSVKQREAVSAAMREKWSLPEYRKMWEATGNTEYGHHHDYESSKFGHRWHLKSNVELLFVTLCEEDPNVVSLDYEKDVIQYTLSDKKHSYIIDFTVELMDGSVYYVECKYKDKPSDSLVLKNKYDSAHNYYGSSYRWVTREPLLSVESSLRCISDYLIGGGGILEN